MNSHPRPHITGPGPRIVHLAMLCALALVLGVGAAGCGKSTIPTGPAPAKRKAPSGTFKPYTIKGKTYYPMGSADGYMEEGLASWYGKDFHGKKTASGEVYNMYALTAAHKVLPMHTVVQVTNLENGRSVNLRINDRGPFVRGRIIDLSYEGAKQLDIVGAGTARVRVAASGDSIPGYKHGELPGRFYVQVGSFTVKQNADRLVADVRARGYRETRIQRAIVGGKRFWRVQAGVFTSLNAARAAQDRLESQYPSCFVIAD